MERLAPDAYSKRLAGHIKGIVESSGAASPVFFRELIVEAIKDVLALYRLPLDLSALRGSTATTLGSVIEQRTIDALELRRGTKLDAFALGREFELKWSLRQRYEIGPTQVGEHCLFLGVRNQRFEVGVFRADLLRSRIQLLGELNGDRKRSFAPRPVAGRGADRGRAVAWLVRNEPLLLDALVTQKL